MGVFSAFPPITIGLCLVLVTVSVFLHAGWCVRDEVRSLSRGDEPKPEDPHMKPLEDNDDREQVVICPEPGEVDIKILPTITAPEQSSTPPKATNAVDDDNESSSGLFPSAAGLGMLCAAAPISQDDGTLEGMVEKLGKLEALARELSSAQSTTPEVEELAKHVAKRMLKIHHSELANDQQ